MNCEVMSELAQQHDRLDSEHCSILTQITKYRVVWAPSRDMLPLKLFMDKKV